MTSPLPSTELAAFVNVGERTNVSGSAKFRRLIQDDDYVAALGVARDQVENGAMILDVNMDDGLIDGAEAMARYLRLIAAEPDIAAVPIMIDSSRFDVICAGLRNCSGKPVVNSISMKEGESAFLDQARLVQSFGAAAVIMAFDEKGQAETAADKVRISSRAYELLVDRLGYHPQDIIFDPNIFAVATGMAEHNNFAFAFFEATQELRKRFPHSHISGGVSNVSFALRGQNAVREVMHAIFLYHAQRYGMSMAIVNAGRMPVYSQIDAGLRGLVEDVYFNRHDQAGEALLEYTLKNDTKSSSVRATADVRWRDNRVEERLSHALVHGIGTHIEKDVVEAHEKLSSALQVIEGPLMAGMNRVGDLFGKGEMFLPQVVKSARIMKQAVGILTPWLEQEKAADQSSEAPKNQGRILLATVKGDVHDIGKNIVGVVLRCNGFDVVDLGVMVPAARILEYAGLERVDVIGLSGLITPSLDEMAHVAEELQRAGFTQPLMVGGATTSRLHTALRIAPKYDQGVVHVLDAARASQVAKALIEPEKRKPYLDAVKVDYEALSLQYAKTQRPLADYSTACQNRLQVDWSAYRPTRPKNIGVQTLAKYPVARLLKYIDWQPFFRAWELKGRYPALLEKGPEKDVARELLKNAEAMLQTMMAHDWTKPKATFALWPAVAQGESILVYKNEDKKEELGRLHFLRQQMKRNPGRANLSLVDFVAPAETGIDDYIGAFAVTAGKEIDSLAADYKDKGDDYNSILLQSLSDRLVEAFAEHLHERVRKEFWGYAKEEKLDNDDLIAESYQGIRPAHGYPACIDHYEKVKVVQWLDCENTVDIHLTESFALQPSASVVGMYFSHPESRYFGIGRIGKDQLKAYAEIQNRSTVDVVKSLAGYLPPRDAA